MNSSAPRSLCCRVADPEDSVRWDEYIARSANGAMYHTTRFISYHRAPPFVVHNLIIEDDGGTWTAVLPAAVRVGNGGHSECWSHCGASWGGFVFAEPPSLHKCVDVVDATLEHLKTLGCSRIHITLPPDIMWGDYRVAAVEYALLSRGFIRTREELSSVINLSHVRERKALPASGSFVRAVRHADRAGVRVEVEDGEDSWSSFYAILESRLWSKYAVKPTHTCEDLRYLRDAHGEAIKLFVARTAAGEMAAGMVVFEVKKDVAVAFYMAHVVEMQKLRAMNVVYTDAAMSYARRGFRWFDLGLFTVRGTPNVGLETFKRRCGGGTAIRTTWSYQVRQIPQ